MTADLTLILYAAAGIGILLVLGKVALVPANRLHLGVFRPYRGDPWPVGVQEDDDARFAWTRAQRVGSPRVPEALGIEDLVTPGPDGPALTRIDADIRRGGR
jgi:hypothetical protein